MTTPLLTSIDSFWLYMDGWSTEDGRVTVPVRRKVSDGPADEIDLVLPIEGYTALLYRSDTPANRPTLCRLESLFGGPHYLIVGTPSALVEFAECFDKEA